MNATKTLPNCRIQDKPSGPYRKEATGKFAADGCTPIRRTVAPYWTVEYMAGTARASRRFSSVQSAQSFIDSLAPCDLVMC